MSQIFIQESGFCACGCGKQLTGKKKKWATEDCAYTAYIKFAIIKGDTKIIRQELFKRDKGVCCYCGNITSTWHADHIKEVCRGGGACNLNNFQTLCLRCHKQKTTQFAICFLFPHKQLPRFSTY